MLDSWRSFINLLGVGMKQFRMDRGLLSGFAYISLLLVLSAYFTLSMNKDASKTLSLQAKAGLMSLTFWYPQTSRPIPLSGEWLSFPDQLLHPTEVEQNLSGSIPVTFPDIWQPPGPRRHVTTYTLELNDIPEKIDLGLFVPEVKNSFRLFLDDREIASGGNTTVMSGQERGYFGNKIVYIGQLTEDARLTLQVSNYGHARGGVHESMILAPYEHWQSVYRTNTLIEGVVICLALLAGSLMLIEFFLVPEHKSLLWLALFSLVLAGYTGTTGLGSFATLFGSFPWQVAVRLEYIGFSASIPLFLNWLAALYRDDVKRWPVRYLLWLSGGMVLVILLTPSVLFTELLYFFLIYMCACMLLSIWIMLHLFILNRPGIRILAFGAFFLLVSIFHDLSIFLGWLEGDGVLGIGVLVFLVAQIGFLTFYRTQEQVRILDLNQSLQASTQEAEGAIESYKETLKQKVQALEQKKKEHKKLVSEDSLTGLVNRHYFFQQIARRLERNHRISFAVIMIDVDHFKQINDHLGRDFAEGVLCKVAEQLVLACDGHFDWIPARYGGDEFVFWLGGADHTHAVALAQKIQADISRIQIPILSQPEEVFRFSVSMGVAVNDQGISSLDALLAKAADDLHHQRKKSQQKSALSQSHLFSPSNNTSVKQ